jgi:RND family efflux transporter MFP subunit
LNARLSNRVKHSGLVFGVVSLLTVLSYGCGRASTPAKPDALPAIAVRTQIVERKPGVATEDVMGTVRAKLHAVIEAKISGKIDRIPVVPGQSVKAGELLAELDARDAQARVDQAQAVRQQAEADLKRFTQLWDQKIVSRAEYDNALARFRVADASALEAQTLLDYARVVAPFDGVITRKWVDVGDLASPGKPLLEMEDARKLRLDADVPEAAMEEIQLGDKLPVRIESLEKDLQGVVSEIAPAADPSSRTFLVKLDLPPTPGVRAGQFGRVTVPVGKTSSLRVPASAVTQRGQMRIVFVLDKGQASLRLVKTGKVVGKEVEIASGLDAGESVILDGVAGMRDGQPVEVK